MKKLLFVMAIGAGLAWAFDPDSGPQRRESLRRKFDEKVGGRTDATPAPVVTPSSSMSKIGHTPDDLAVPTLG